MIFWKEFLILKERASLLPIIFAPSGRMIERQRGTRTSPVESFVSLLTFLSTTSTFVLEALFSGRLLVYQWAPTVHLYYTCQLFLRYKREIFILGVLGFLKTTPSFPKIPEEFRSLPKKSEVFRRRPKTAEGEVIEKTLIHKIRDREEGIVIYSFYTWFLFLTWV